MIRRGRCRGRHGPVLPRHLRSRVAQVLTSADPAALDRVRRHAKIFFELEGKAVLAYPFTEESAKAIAQPVLFVADRGAARSGAESAVQVMDAAD